ncbi:hypothetical protein QQZ08_012519 [Neonectria magnoliae]|uniref:Uncharacterized protein n=1 Tax=Neonectria magnoliae TaxID=2732573 RepID=A0ABR1H0Q3_9HYPO
MPSSKKAASAAYVIIGKVTKDAVVKASGTTWGAALETGTQIAQATYPRIDAIKVHGAKAHQSHNVPSHSAVLSVAFYDGKKRIVSGHIHQDGRVDFSKAGGSSSGSASTQPQFATGLTWQIDPGNPRQALWWNGTGWENGQWSDEHQLWLAYCNGTWYAWAQ